VGSNFVPYTANNVALGLNYIGFIQPDLKLTLSLTGVFASARPEVSTPAPGGSLGRKRVQSVALGGVINYHSFAFGAEYATCGRSMQLATSRLAVSPGGALAPLNYNAKEAQAPRWWNVGASYLYKQTKFALGYLQSSRKTGFGNTATAKVVNVSVTYQRQPGLDIYVEGFNVKTTNDKALYEGKLRAQNLPTGKSVSIIKNQKANVLVVGMKVSF
jgi:predicted porin